MKNDSPSTFIAACRREATDSIPIWLMRQAGRYLPEYRAVREKHSLLEIIGQPELAAEVTLQPIRRFGLDAAIIFADILPPLIGMGLELEFVPGDGPVIRNPVRAPYDVDVLATPPAEETMASTLEAIRIVTSELRGAGTPLIGFAGAPFTLATYAIEGGASKTYATAKTFMYREPSAWKRLMTKLVTVQVDYLRNQIRAGAAAVQIFDSWVGLALSRDDYERHVAPYNTMLIEAVAAENVPIIQYSGGTGAYLDAVAACGGDVVSVDWRIPIDAAWDRIGHDRAIQGNLDPVALSAPPRELAAQVHSIIEKVRGRRGFVFNVGHGLLPSTPIDGVQRLIELVRTAPVGKEVGEV